MTKDPMKDAGVFVWEGRTVHLVADADGMDNCGPPGREDTRDALFVIVLGAIPKTAGVQPMLLIKAGKATALTRINTPIGRN